MEAQTLGVHQAAYDGVFQHPIARNLNWRDVKSMLASLAEMSEHDGKFKFTRNGHSFPTIPTARIATCKAWRARMAVSARRRSNRSMKPWRNPSSAGARFWSSGARRGEEARWTTCSWNSRGITRMLPGESSDRSS